MLSSEHSPTATGKEYVRVYANSIYAKEGFSIS